MLINGKNKLVLLIPLPDAFLCFVFQLVLTQGQCLVQSYFFFLRVVPAKK